MPATPALSFGAPATPAAAAGPREQDGPGDEAGSDPPSSTSSEDELLAAADASPSGVKRKAGQGEEQPAVARPRAAPPEQGQGEKRKAEDSPRGSEPGGGGSAIRTIETVDAEWHETMGIEATFAEETLSGDEEVANDDLPPTLPQDTVEELDEAAEIEEIERLEKMGVLLQDTGEDAEHLSTTFAKVWKKGEHGWFRRARLVAGQYKWATQMDDDETFAPASVAPLGYYPLGGKGGPANKGKGSSSKGPGKEGGPPQCTACGAMGHRWFECSKRSPGAGTGKGKGSGKGKQKGKSKGFRPKGFKGKGSGTYASDVGYVGSYFFSIVEQPSEEPYYLPVSVHQIEDAFVLSCAGTPPGHLRGSQVIIDTGATESACGISTLDNFLEATQCRYSVVLNDRPTFRFGDGRTLQAVSRVDLVTAAIGTFSVYVLDHMASQSTHLLLGSRALRALKAVISYSDETLMFQRRSGEVRLLPISTTPGGHLVIDLAARSTGLGPVRQYILEKFGVTAPPEESDLQGMLAVPGFSEESRRGQSGMIPGTEDDNAPPRIGQALQMMSTVPQKSCYVLEEVEHSSLQRPCHHDVVPPAQCPGRSEWCLPAFATCTPEEQNVEPLQTNATVRDLRLKLIVALVQI